MPRDLALVSGLACRITQRRSGPPSRRGKATRHEHEDHGRMSSAARTARMMVASAGRPEPGRVITVFGGTGFLGCRVVRHLLDHGFSVRIAARHPERALALLAPDRAGVEAV